MDLKNDKDILQNLKEADCSDEFIEEFFRVRKHGNDKMLVQLLYKHKSQLLEALHDSQKKIDCLDYLIFQIEQVVNLKKKEQI